MKKILLVSLVIILLLATAGSAMAAGGPHGRGLGGGGQRQAGKGAGAYASGYFTLTGVITGINGIDVTVYVQGGSPLTRPYRGQSLTLATDEATRFLMVNEDGTTTTISFADLAVDQKVSAAGKLTEDVWLATRITVGADVIHYP